MVLSQRKVRKGEKGDAALTGDPPVTFRKESSSRAKKLFGVILLKNAGPQTPVNDHHASNYIDNLRDRFRIYQPTG
jgi:hypothetical protein